MYLYCKNCGLESKWKFQMSSDWIDLWHGLWPNSKLTEPNVCTIGLVYVLRLRAIDLRLRVKQRSQLQLHFRHQYLYRNHHLELPSHLLVRQPNQIKSNFPSFSMPNVQLMRWRYLQPFRILILELVVAHRQHPSNRNQIHLIHVETFSFKSTKWQSIKYSKMYSARMWR